MVFRSLVRCLARRRSSASTAGWVMVCMVACMHEHGQFPRLGMPLSYLLIFSRSFSPFPTCLWHFEPSVDICMFNHIASLVPASACVSSVFVTCQLRHKSRTYHNPLLSFCGFSGFGENLRSCLLHHYMASHHSLTFPSWLFFLFHFRNVNRLLTPRRVILQKPWSQAASVTWQVFLSKRTEPGLFPTNMDLVQDEF